MNFYCRLFVFTWFVGPGVTSALWTANHFHDWGDYRSLAGDLFFGFLGGIGFAGLAALFLLVVAWVIFGAPQEGG